MAASTIATIIVILFIAAAAVYGYARGFLKILITTAALIVTLAASFFIAPYFAKLLEGTSIGKTTEGQPLSSLNLQIIAFFIVAVLIYVVIRVILGVAHVIAKIPIIGGANRILGAVIGIVEALLVIWIACLIIQSLAATPFGVQATKIISQSDVLKFFFDNNLLETIALKVFQK